MQDPYRRRDLLNKKTQQIQDSRLQKTQKPLCEGLSFFAMRIPKEMSFEMSPDVRIKQSAAPGCGAKAMAALRRKVAVAPSADAWFGLGNALHETGEDEEACECYLQAVRLNPDFPDAYNNLACAEKLLGRREDCMYHARMAVQLAPWNAVACNTLGQAFYERGDIEEAIGYYRLSIARDRGYAQAYCNLGNALRDLHRLDESLFVLNEALRIDPEFVDAQWNRSLTYLQGGNLVAGWSDYEARYRTRFAHEQSRNFESPSWHGESLCGRDILLYAEQGFGDTIQFVRYVSRIAALGPRSVYLEVQPALERLVRTVEGVSAAFRFFDANLPPFDFHCSLMSLPHRLGARLETIPADVPYLFVPAEVSKVWAERMRDDRNLRVGLVWSSNVFNKAIHGRKSIPLRELHALSTCSGASFYSLQKGEGCKEIVSAGVPLIDWSDDLRDFCDTAALIVNLDLVITVDTAVAHLAGALGKPVWMLASYCTDWRWLQDRNDSPWYPTMRLFRQDRVGDWSAPLERLHMVLVDASRQFAEERRFVNPPPLPVQDSMLDVATLEASEAAKNEGNAAYGKGDMEEAERRYLKAVALNPEYAEAHNNLALVLRARGEDLEAEKHLLRAIATKPDLTNAHFNLGCLFADQGRVQPAIDAFRSILDAEPQHAAARAELDDLLGRQAGSATAEN